jgi:hypothetical protein
VYVGGLFVQSNRKKEPVRTSFSVHTFKYLLLLALRSAAIMATEVVSDEHP